MIVGFQIAKIRSKLAITTSTGITLGKSIEDSRMELVDFNRYVWRTDPSVPGRHLREAGGGEVIEDIWKLTKHGEQNLFLGIYATSTIPVDSKTLFAHVKKAWRSLRWEVPIIAASTSHIWHGEGKVPTTFITYDEAKSEGDVEKWINETTEIFPTYGADNKTLDDLRSFHILRPNSDCFCAPPIHLTSYMDDPTGYATSENAKMEWGTGKEAGWLMPIVTEILREEELEVKDEHGKVISEAKKAEPRDGPEYWQTLGEVMNGLVEGMPRAHQFKSFIEPRFDPTTSTPKTRRIEHKFTLEESIKIHAAGAVGANGLTEKLTVNHLVHGALSLLPLFDNPPPADTNALVFYYGLVDGRQRLRKDYRDPLAYPGYCLGMSAVHVPASLFHQFPSDDKKGLVVAYAKEMKKEYMKQAAYPALVAIEPQQGDLMLSAPAPPPWSGPAYAADGKGAIYLHPTYAGKQGKTIIEVDD